MSILFCINLVFFKTPHLASPAMGDVVELESPLLGGDLGVGKSVIREIFTEISRPRNPPLTPPKRGIICATIKYVNLENGHLRSSA